MEFLFWGSVRTLSYLLHLICMGLKRFYGFVICFSKLRRKLQPIWSKAVDFIAANESRIRLENRLIHGDEFEVWHWLPPSLHNGKIWQGQGSCFFFFFQSMVHLMDYLPFV